MEKKFISCSDSVKQQISKIYVGENVKIMPFVNLYECELGDNVFIGPFVEIQKGVKIGNRTRVSSHTFICEGVEIGDDCFLAHGIMFINDKFTETRNNWILRKTKIGNRVRIGSNATILPVEIGDDVIIGAGAVVTKNIPPNTTVAGNPAKVFTAHSEGYWNGM